MSVRSGTGASKTRSTRCQRQADRTTPTKVTSDRGTRAGARSSSVVPARACSSSRSGALVTSTPRSATLTSDAQRRTSSPAPGRGDDRRAVTHGRTAYVPSGGASGAGAGAAPPIRVTHGAMRITTDDGVGLAVEVAGTGPGLLLVHGFGGAKEDFADHVAALARDHTVVIVRPSRPRRERQARRPAGVLARPPRRRHARGRRRGRARPLPAARPLDGRHGRAPDRARPAATGSTRSS